MISKKWILGISLFCFTHAYSSEKLIFAIDLVRHGDRTPIHAIPNAPYPWSEGLGQLTPEGMKEEYELGKQLRNKYVDQTHLLPPYYKTETMYVRSTDFDRTLMSAEALLMGLYPLGAGPHLSNSKQVALPEGYQPIPIHTRSKNDDQCLIPSIDRLKQENLLAKYVFTSKEWKEKNAQLQSNFARWSEATGIRITHLRQLSAIGSTLNIHQLHHLPFPPMLNAEEVNEIIAAGKWVIAAKYKPKEIGKENGYPLLIAIINYLEQVVKAPSPLKYVLLSGHDTTILSLMSAMQVPLDQPPSYAADLNFSLYYVGPEQYLIRVSLNDRPVNLPGCNGSICTWNQFKKIVR